MAILASALMSLAAAQLNDPGQGSYTNAVLLPHLKNAFKRLTSALMINDLKYTQETSSDIDIPADTTELAYGSSPALPADLVLPIMLWEKPDGADSDEYTPMQRLDYQPFRDQDSELLDWWWEENKIKFVGATVAVDVRIRYEKMIAQIQTENTSIELLDLDLFLSSQTAAFAAIIVGGNKELSDYNQGIADSELDKLIRNRIKDRQSLPARRRPYGFYRRNRRR